MDQVLHETHKNRKITNHIAHSTFSGPCCQQGALPTGEKVKSTCNQNYTYLSNSTVLF